MDPKKLVEGNLDTIELTVPSGYKVTIRQQTGDDDDIATSTQYIAKNENLNRFVQAIIVSTEFSNGKQLSLDNILDMKLRDKYFIVISSRIFSLGPILKFEYEWPDGTVAEYEEDLTNYIWDYSLPIGEFPFKGHELYNPYRLKPHPRGNDLDMEFTISTGKVFKFTFINGIGENYLMTLPIDQLSKNAELKARDLRFQMKDQWVKVQNFKTFTAREMMEIRKNVFDIDEVVEVLTEIPHPRTGETVQYPVIGNSDFLFPREL